LALARCRFRPWPRTTLLFRRDVAELADDMRLPRRTGETILRMALAALMQEADGRVQVVSDSDVLAGEYAEATGQTVWTCPIPVRNAFRLIGDRRATEPELQPPLPYLDLLYLGDARTEKGFHRLVALADALRGALEFEGGPRKVRLFAQSNPNMDPPEPKVARALAALENRPGVHLLGGPLSAREYVERMEQAAMILLPYDARRYQARTSGIFVEAVLAAVPVICPQGTWMSAQLRHHGAGAAYWPDESDEVLAEAVRDGLGRVEWLRREAAAADRRVWFLRFHAAERLVRLLLGEEWA